VKISAAIVGGLLLIVLSGAGAAQNYPVKPIRYIVPFATGGTTDILSRLIGAKLTEAWGQQVLIDNRPGAGGNVGSEIAAKSPPDGYTILGGTKMIHVPYKGSGPASLDLLGGQIELMFENSTSAVPYIKAGRMRALGVTTAKRTHVLPDTPTLMEAGLTGFDISSWQGVFTPAGTPQDIVTKLHGEIVRIMGTPDMRRRLADLGLDVIANTPEQFTAFIKVEIEKWQKIIKVSGARVD